MKKILYLLLFIIIFICILTACSSDNESESVVNVGNDITGIPVEITSENITNPPYESQPLETTENIEISQSEQEWHRIYSDYVLNEYEIIMGYITLGLTDFNESGTPELIIVDDSKGSLGGKFTIITIIDGIATKLISSGLSSQYIIYKGELYLYRDFDSLNGGGGTFGYGYVSIVDNTNGPLTGSGMGFYDPDPNNVLQYNIKC